ncbi:hypothetical protein A9Q83_05770 [Alphaproteobacteria bacterium 46_93_T64]|nr:hypothetical protein A9Q83_05770 [Alphaproteobacteria bacterium 46_93_T64]
MTTHIKNADDIVIRPVEKEDDIRSIFNLMQELRPNLKEMGEYVDQIFRQIKSGYKLLVAYQKDLPIGLAGYRFSENTIRGRFVYVDDLVVTSAARGYKVGEVLLKTVSAEGAKYDCSHLVLDTGIDNKLGQRFYTNFGMEPTGLHFSQTIPNTD